MNRNILVIAPGENYRDQSYRIKSCIEENNPIIISIGFIPENYSVDFIFCSNPRKYEKASNKDYTYILTSNVRKSDYDCVLLFNYSSYVSDRISQIDNSGITLLRLLRSIGLSKVYVAGMDGYCFRSARNNFPDSRLSSDSEVQKYNVDTKLEIAELRQDMIIDFITDSIYM